MTQARILSIFASLAFSAAVAVPAEAQTSDAAVVLDVEDVEWTEIVPGVDFGAVYGVFTEEPHGKMVRFEPGLVSPMHTHSHAYHGVVIEGTAINPYEGEDPPVEMGPGAYWYVPAGVAHKTGCVSEEPCLLYTHGDALWDIQLPEGERATTGSR